MGRPASSDDRDGGAAHRPVRARRDRDDPLAGSGPSLAAWVASLVADEAARSRARTAWLARQAAEEGTFAGVLADLAERATPLVVHLHNGRRHRGRLTIVGRDFCGLRTDGHLDVLVAHRGLASVRTLPADAVTIGDRPVHTDLVLAEALASVVEHRRRVLVVGHDAADAVAGELRAVGADVVTLRLDGERATAYLAVGAILEVTVAEPG